ncbi:MAG: T9SS type A sorting domain-containing protein [Rhodothermales bacterium]|nr:T9SS type A sorting domain-containing protein [Rhodothermales bacterium]
MSLRALLLAFLPLLLAAVASEPLAQSRPAAADGIVPTRAGAVGGGTQSLRARLIQDDGTVGGTLKVAIEVKTDGLAANTLGSATVDLGFDPALMTLSGVEDGVLDGFDAYTVDPSFIGGGSVLRLTITSQGVGTGVLDEDGYEVGNTFETLLTYVFTIDAAFDRTDFPINCSSLSVGYYDDLDNADGDGVIVDNTIGAVPMESVLPLALRTLNLSAPEGWRVLSGLPGMTVDDLLGDLTTQGFPGADNESAFTNVWNWEEANGWVGAASQTEALQPTEGLAFFALGSDLPASVRVAGAIADNDYATGSPASCSAFPLAFDVSYTDPGSSGYFPGWNLEGNPTANTLDWDAPGWTKTSLSNTIWIYDPVSAQYLTWNGTTGTLGDGLIAPLQGFWVNATAAAPALVAPAAAETTGGVLQARPATGPVLAADGGGSTPGPADRLAPADHEALSEAGLVRLRLEGALGEHDRWAEAFVSFQDGATAGIDRYDAQALASLSSTSLDLYAVLDSDSGLEALEIDARPKSALATLAAGSSLEIPLSAEAFADGVAAAGPFELMWEAPEGLPRGVSVALVDAETGARLDLTRAGSYAFVLGSEAGRASSATKREPPARLAPQDRAGAARVIESEAGRGHDRAAAARESEPTLSERRSHAIQAQKQDRRRAPSRTMSVADDYAGTRTAPESGPAPRAASPTEAPRFLLRFTRSSAALEDAGAGGDGAVAARGADATDGTVRADLRASLPEAFAFDGAYPNPSKGRVTLRYGLPEGATVELAVYDVLGRRIAVLADGEEEAGWHERTWEAGSFPSGVYVVRLRASEHLFTRALTLVR